MDSKFDSIAPLLARKSPYCAPSFEEDFKANLGIFQDETRILVVGSGGLGCELLKNFALSGFKDITTIDLDTIDVSNLNRQFLFRKEDVGAPKAATAAAFIEKRCNGVTVKHYRRKIQEFSKEWYTNFNIIVAGLDNVEARRWLNNTVIDLAKVDPETGEVDMQTVIPLIDGGTQGFGGQSRLFMPRLTSCFECSMDSMPEEKGHFMKCTIANIPRIPEHCIDYAMSILWRRLVSMEDCKNYEMCPEDTPEADLPDGVKLDKDDENHMTWLYERALERAEKFGIQGVTYNLTMQFTKNIIPAIASTNALVSAECVNEAMKLTGMCGQNLDNYFMFMGGEQTGINADTFSYYRNPSCAACRPPICVVLPADGTIQDLLNKLEEKKISKPNLQFNGKVLYAPLEAFQGLKTRLVKDDVGHKDVIQVIGADQEKHKCMVFYEIEWAQEKAARDEY